MKRNEPFNVLMPGANVNSWSNTPRATVVGQAIFAAIGQSALGSTVLFTLGTYTVTLATAVGYLVTTAITSWATKALMPKTPGFNNESSGILVNNRSNSGPQDFVYGQMRKGGTVTFYETTGEKNKYLHQIISISGHEVNSLGDIYINDEVVSLDSDGFVVGDTWKSKVRIYKHLGNQTSATDSFANVSSKNLANTLHTDTTADSNFVGKGIAYLYVRYEFDRDVFASGLPLVTVVVEGKKVFDPRTSTTAYSNNAALCLRDFLVSSYGLNDSSIDDTFFQAAANECDESVSLSGGGAEPRYDINGIVRADEPIGSVLEDMTAAMAGTLYWGQGTWKLKAGAYSAPIEDFGLDDLRGPISLDTRITMRDNFNKVAGTFVDSENRWITTDYPQIMAETSAGNFVTGKVYTITEVGSTNFTSIGASANSTGVTFTATGSGSGDGKASAFLGEDNGQESILDLPFTFVTSASTAQRLAKLTLLRAREQMTFSATFSMKAFEVEVGDIIRLSNERYGWTNKTFEVVGWSLFADGDDGSLKINLTLRETSAAAFDWNAEESAIINNNTTLPSFNDAEAINGLKSRNNGFLDADGHFVPRVALDWDDTAGGFFDHYEVQHKNNFLSNVTLAQHIDFAGGPIVSTDQTVFADKSGNLRTAFNDQSYQGYTVNTGGPTGVFLQKSTPESASGLALLSHSQIQALDTTNGFGHTFWFRHDDLSATDSLARLYTRDASDYGALYWQTAGYWENTWTSDNITLTEGEWYFFYLARAGSVNTLKIYAEDGTLVKNNTATVVETSSKGIAIFGNSESALETVDSDGEYNNLDTETEVHGSIADIRLHNGGILSDAQVLKLLSGDTGDKYVTFNALESHASLLGYLVGDEINYRIRSVNQLGVRGQFSTGTIQVAGDSNAPDAPTSFLATGIFAGISLSWTNPAASDLDVIEVYRNTTNSSAGSTKIAEVKGDSFTDDGLPVNTTYFYWLKSKDRTGNLSGFSATQSAVTDYVSESNIDPTYINSVDTAAASATAAQAAQTAAETAETNAETAETNAAAARTAAQTAQTNAETAETNAASSATSAAGSATSASGSATTATTQAGNATTSAGQAATSATNASGSSSSAATSATTAATAATNAETSLNNIVHTNLVSNSKTGSDARLAGMSTLFATNTSQSKFNSRSWRWQGSSVYQILWSSSSETDFPIEVVTGNKYTWGMWVYQNTGSSKTIQFAFQQGGGWANSYHTVPNAAWTWIYDSGTAPSSIGGSLILDLRGTTYAQLQNALWIDGVTVVEGEVDLDEAIASDASVGYRASTAESASAAATSETNAAASETAAASSASSASTSANTATTKASEASTSATNAATSATNASGSASSASTSASNAATSETNASNSASAASTSASAASTSASNASTSASTASTQASTATTKASEASTSATQAASSATDADASAINALRTETRLNKLNQAAGMLAPQVALKSANYKFAVWEDGTTIYRNGVEMTTLDRGVIYQQASVAEGDRFTSTKPFYAATVSGSQSNVPLASEAMADTNFAYYASRYHTINIRVYALADGNVTWKYSSSWPTGGSVSGGTTVSLTAGTPTSINPGSSNGYVIFESDVPILVAKWGTSGDGDVLHPLSAEVWHRRDNGPEEFGDNHASNTVVSKGGGWYQSSDAETKLHMYAIGDGAGGDSEGQIGWEACGDEYVLPGNRIDEFSIGARDATVVTVKDKNGTVIYTYDMSAYSVQNTGATAGSSGPLNSNGPFYFSGTKPFALEAQLDNLQDEHTIYGFRRDLKPRYGTEAVTEILQSSVTDLEGNQAAAITLRAKAGTGGAQLELVAADNVSGGSVSTARIDADNIILDGTVSAGLLEAESITSGAIASGSVDADKIAAGSISASKIVTEGITADKLDINETLTLGGASSGFIAGRTSQSDFGTDGFYIGRTSNTGNTATGFQLSHTSITDGNHPQLSNGTVQAIIHDDQSGLRIYEPVFYQRGNASGADTLITAAGNSNSVSLSAGDIHTITLIGGGGGGGSATAVAGGASGNSGGSGNTTSIQISGYSSGSYNGANNFSASGGSGAAAVTVSNGGGVPQGLNGKASVFGAGGLGGNAGGNNNSGGNGSAPAANSYGAGGGGGGSANTNDWRGFENNGAGQGGEGGFQATPVTVTIDLTNSNNNATLKANAVGNGGSGGSISGQGNGGSGRQGVVAVSGVLDGYNATNLADLSAYAPVAEANCFGSYRGGSPTTASFSAQLGDAFNLVLKSSSDFRNIMTRGGNAVFTAGKVSSPGNVNYNIAVSGANSNTGQFANATICQWRRG